MPTPRPTDRRGPLDRIRAMDRWLRAGLATVLVLAIALGVMLFVHSLRVGDRTYHADFAQSAGLEPGDSVTDAGIPVGTVTTMRLAGDRVSVTMKIQRKVRLGAATGAAIKLTTLLGSRYVELRPAGRGSLAGASIPLSRTEVPYDVETALQQATTTFGGVDADRIAQSMTTLAQHLQGTPALLPGLLNNVRTLSTLIATRRAQIGQLLTSTAQVTSVIHKQQSDLGVMVQEGSSLLQQINSRRAAIVRLIDATTALVRQIEPIAVGDRAQIEQLLTDLQAMTTAIAGHDDLLRNTLQILPVPWRLFANATGSGREVVANGPDSAFIDTYMCALSARARQVGRAPYLEGCK